MASHQHKNIPPSTALKQHERDDSGDSIISKKEETVTDNAQSTPKNFSQSQLSSTQSIFGTTQNTLPVKASTSKFVATNKHKKESTAGVMTG